MMMMVGVEINGDSLRKSLDLCHNSGELRVRKDTIQRFSWLYIFSETNVPSVIHHDSM